MNLRLPATLNMTNAQMASYLYQMVQDLNMALLQVENQASEVRITADNAAQEAGKTPEQKFADLKALIIKSADIVNEYYETMQTRLSGDYVAQSTFGTFSEKTTADLEASSKAIEQNYQNLQTIESYMIGVNAYINTGLLYYTDQAVPVYGVEVGQRTETDGKEVFNKYARFTSDKLSFFDANGNEVAYFADYKLYETNVQITGTFQVGDLVDSAMSDGSVVTTYIGG